MNEERTGPAAPALGISLTAAEQALVESNISLIYFVAARYRGIGATTYEDLVGRLFHRLCICIARFDPSRGFQLSPYVVRSLDGEAKNFFRDEIWTIRPPRKLRENWSSEVAQRLAAGTSVLGGESRETIESCARPISLDALNHQNPHANSGPETLAADIDVEAEVIAKIGSPQLIRELFAWLAPEERYILALMMRGKPLSLLQERFQLTAPQARLVWRELQEKVKPAYFALIEGETPAPSTGSQVLAQLLRRRFVPPVSGFVDRRQAPF